MGKRVFLIVLDSVGCGDAPDAEKFNDKGADTLGTCVRSGELVVPVMAGLGLYNIDGTSFEDDRKYVRGCYGRLTERSGGKDTTAGHWEIAGYMTEKPMPTFPDGFPEETIKAFEEATGRKAICNKPYSGTEVIKDYGQEHEKTGAYIVYTSADSVFQIAAHEDVVPVEQLYEDCKKARAILQGDTGVGRVIARPFIGTYPNYERTVRRHDFSLQPPKDTVMDVLQKAGLHTIGVGKIYDIFAGKGIAETYPNEGNYKNMELTIDLLDKDFTGMCFVNLVDFDMTYGHRRDIPGYTAALNEVDEQLGRFIDKMG
ncbi:MAG: phosphopentomutase, partial [Lachnospiraceae bacterium]|nr:phosphopentomutase [Lachnospiraceae bacterium]